MDNWAATSFLCPSIRKAAGTGTRRVYGFSDLVAARVARDLRSAGVSLHGLRKVVKEVRKLQFWSPPADARLIVSGEDVHVTSNADLISTLNKSGQLRFPLTILDLEATIATLGGHSGFGGPEQLLLDFTGEGFSKGSELVSQRAQSVERIRPSTKAVA
jgi:hypothetical protein